MTEPVLVAQLGPTNTGKTYRAIERMLQHRTGILGLPLRLLAREVYDKVGARVGFDRVALLTGEEKRVPPAADYFVCTVEAMPLSRAVEFVAIDEIQLAAHPQRGHVFTDRLLHARGERETWLLGALTMRDVLRQLVPGAIVETHPRLSALGWAGATRLSQLRPRSAIVAFSVGEVYALAEQLRVAKGGAAVVLGALSPRARNAQVAMFQAGEVDYLVATDAIGMGLNLDVEHVAFAALDKFDGREVRPLDLAELGQIAGRAGRFMKDGTFGVLEPLSLPPWAVSAVSESRFPPVERVRWRLHGLDFSTVEALLGSLRAKPPLPLLMPALGAEDTAALEWLSERPTVRARLGDRASVELLWQVCQIPDFRKLLFEAHVGLLEEIFFELHAHGGRARGRWFGEKLAALETPAPDVETLTAQIAALRTWAYVANSAGWVDDAAHWQRRAAMLEDTLSDALHAALVERFVVRVGKQAAARQRAQQRREDDRRAKLTGPFAALRGLRDAMAQSGVGQDEGARIEALCDAPHERFGVSREGRIDGLIDDAQGQLEVALADWVAGTSLGLPNVRMRDVLPVPAGVRLRLERRVTGFSRDLVSRLLAPLQRLQQAPNAGARALGFALEQGLGSAPPVTTRLTQAELVPLKAAGVTLGRLSSFSRALLERRPLLLRLALVKARYALAPRSLPQVATDCFVPSRELPREALLALGYVALGPLAVRADLAERLVAGRDGRLVAGRDGRLVAGRDGRLVAGRDERELMRMLGCSREVARAVCSALDAALR